MRYFIKRKNLFNRIEIDPNLNGYNLPQISGARDNYSQASNGYSVPATPTCHLSKVAIIRDLAQNISIIQISGKKREIKHTTKARKKKEEAPNLTG